MPSRGVTVPQVRPPRPAGAFEGPVEPEGFAVNQGASLRALGRIREPGKEGRFADQARPPAEL